MAKKIRITKANQIAVNNIRASKRECNVAREKIAYWTKLNDDQIKDAEVNIKMYEDSYDRYVTIWNAQIDMFAEMVGLDFLEVIQDDNYRIMADIADANL